MMTFQMHKIHSADETIQQNFSIMKWCIAQRIHLEELPQCVHSGWDSTSSNSNSIMQIQA